MSDFELFNPEIQRFAKQVSTYCLLACLIATLALWTTAANAGSTTLDWWWLTLDGMDHHNPDNAVAWHGRLMVIAWSVCTPIGVLIARFYKVTPNQPFPAQLDNQFWWITHRLLQYASALLTAIAIFVIMQHTAKVPPESLTSTLHLFAGWTLCGLCVVQIVSAWLRGSKGGPVNIYAWPDSQVVPGDHYNLTRRRVAFETIHITLGYITIALALTTSLLGLSASAAPRWMWAGLILWWILVSLRYAQLTRRNDYVRTYQAIWGTAPEHPGNQVSKANKNLAAIQSRINSQHN